MTDQREKRIDHIRDKHQTAISYRAERINVGVDEIGLLLSELSRLQVENESYASEHGRLMDKVLHIHAEKQRLQVERDKAIAELRRFAERDPYATGSSAKRVLSELGVPHETT